LQRQTSFSRIADFGIVLGFKTADIAQLGIDRYTGQIFGLLYRYIGIGQNGRFSWPQ